MEFAHKVWRLLVAVKDALVLAVMLLFFAGLYMLLAGRPAALGVRNGALLVRLNGTVVEEPARLKLSDVLSGDGVPGQTSARDVERALRGAVGDSHVKAVVIDMSNFTGSGLVSAEEIGAAMDRVRASGKPVFAYGQNLQDAGLLIGAHASELWLDPLGSAFLPGPGGYHLYYGKLLEKLKIDVHIFRVGTYKDYVEPYVRNDASPASKEAEGALLGALWGDIQADIHKARPRADIARVISDPVGWVKASDGDLAKAALAAGLVDHLGDWASFGARVAKVAGEDANSSRPGAFAHTTLAAWLAANPESTDGKPIGVVTVAGDITDGKAGPGTAGGERIVRLIDDASNKHLAALVVRVDSPGGSVTGAEAIRAAIMRMKARGVPVVVSMANVAASGGYWVSTPGTHIFARPGTITGSIGIFAILPSFEHLLANYGVTGDGVRATPLSGQPDALTGFSPEMQAVLQANIENGYGRFVGLVANARHKTPAQVDAIAQGRVWDGQSAQKLGLVDEMGGLDAALAYAAGQAHLKAGEWHPMWLGQNDSGFVQWVAAQMQDDDEDDTSAADGRAADLAALVAARQQAALGAALGQAEALVASPGTRAYCLECGAAMPMAAPARGAAGQGAMVGWLVRLAALARGLGFDPGN